MGRKERRDDVGEGATVGCKYQAAGMEEEAEEDGGKVLVGTHRTRGKCRTGGEESTKRKKEFFTPPYGGSKPLLLQPAAARRLGKTAESSDFA